MLSIPAIQVRSLRFKATSSLPENTDAQKMLSQILVVDERPQFSASWGQVLQTITINRQVSQAEFEAHFDFPEGSLNPLIQAGLLQALPDREGWFEVSPQGHSLLRKVPNPGNLSLQSARARKRRRNA